MNIPIYDGAPGIISGSTPFNFYDNDSSFQVDGPKVCDWIARRLGYPIMDVELQSGSIYAAFEESVNEYWHQINQFQIRNKIVDLQGLTIQGSQANINLSQTVINPSLGRLIDIAENYGTEAMSGGNVDLKVGKIYVSASVQSYDINTLWANVSESGNRIEVKRILHDAPPAITKYFDPYVGTGMGSSQMMEQFGWGGYSPGVNFLMMPVYQDLLRLQAIEFNDQFRKSGYSFELANNKLRLFPVPTYDFPLYFHYIVKSDRYNQPGLITSGSTHVTASYIPNGSIQVSDYSNAPFNRIQYSKINDVGRQWIWQYALATSKEMLGLIRSKYSTIPIPGSELTLNGSDLITQGKEEKESLITKLRELLDQMSPKQLMADKLEEANSIQGVLQLVPLPFYIG